MSLELKFILIDRRYQDLLIGEKNYYKQIEGNQNQLS